MFPTDDRSAVTEIGMTFDSVDPGRHAQFWAVALGYVPAPPPEGWDSWEAFLRDQDVPNDEWDDCAAIRDPAGLRPAISFLKVPEQKTAKNRFHLDIKVSGGRHIDEGKRSQRINEKVAELVAAGATVHARHVIQGHLDHVELLDPEGNEFCVV